MSSSHSPASRFMGCLLGGAVGDALGAPAEGIRNLEAIYRKFGRAGMTSLHPYNGYPDEVIRHNGIGAITDDTTMHAATIGAMMLAMRQPEKLVAYSYKGYVRWGVEQVDGLRMLSFVDLAANWPRELHPFWFSCGAGRGTIAALSTGICGTPEQPLLYDAVIRGKRVTGPNNGCGGMMRAAALAFWPHEQDKFRLGMENAAITHGAQDAYLAAGCVSELVAGVVDGLSLRDAFSRMSMRLRAEKGHDNVLSATEHGWEAGRRSVSFEAIDRLSDLLGHKNAFLAVPVLAQTIYALSAYEHNGISFKGALTLAATHSGDSDSVAAIVGNVLGAKEGEGAVPQDWLLQLQKRHELQALGHVAIRQLAL